jgi:hypothetical protein
MILGTGPGVSSISRYASEGVCFGYFLPVLLSRELIMGKLIESEIMSLKSRKETGLKVLGFELGFIALRSTKKYRNTYLPSTAVFKQYPNESRATDRPKDAPRDRISTLRVGRESLLTKPILL